MTVSFSTGFDWRQLPADYPATYEQLNRRFNQVYSHAAQRLVELSMLGPGDTAVDLGCGTGISTAPLLNAVGRRGLVIGLDPSSDMIEVARHRLPHSNVLWHIGDHNSLSELRRSYNVRSHFDAVISSFTFYYWVQQQDRVHNDVADELVRGGRWAFNTTSYLREVQHEGKMYNGFAAIYRRELNAELWARGYVDGIGTDTGASLPSPYDVWDKLAGDVSFAHVTVEPFRLPISPSDAYRWTIEGFYRFGSKPAISTKLAELPLKERLDVARTVLESVANELDDTGENPTIFNFVATTI